MAEVLSGRIGEEEDMTGRGRGGAKTREYDIIGNISSTCDDACVYFVKKYRWIFVIFKAGISPHYIDVSTMYVL